MQYLCNKQIPLGGTVYHPGDIILDGVVLSERAKKLKKSGYISEIPEDGVLPEGEGMVTLYSQEEVEEMLSKAIEEAVNNTIAEMEQKQEALRAEFIEAEPIQTLPGAYDGVVMIPVKGESTSNGENIQMISIPAKPEEIQQVFGIMQMSAEDGANATAKVTSENVLILLHASDSRKMIRNAAKERADNLFPTKEGLNASEASNEPIGTHTNDTSTKGVDT